MSFFVVYFSFFVLFNKWDLQVKKRKKKDNAIFPILYCWSQKDDSLMNRTSFLQSKTAVASDRHKEASEWILDLLGCPSQYPFPSPPVIDFFTFTFIISFFSSSFLVPLHLPTLQCAVRWDLRLTSSAPCSGPPAPRGCVSYTSAMETCALLSRLKPGNSSEILANYARQITADDHQ